MAAANGTDPFDAYFRRADLDGDGQISGAEAVAFFQGSNLPKSVLAQVWTHADQRKAGFLNRAEFYNALKLVTVAQSKRDLTPEMVKAALYGPASAKIPAPQINIGAAPASQANKVATPTPQMGGGPSPFPQGVGVRGPQGFGNAGPNQQFYPSQPNQSTRPPQVMPAGAGPRPHQSFGGQSLASGGTIAANRPPTSSMSTDWLGGSSNSPVSGISSQVSSRVISPPTVQGGLGISTSGFSPSVQARPPATTGQAATSPVPQGPDSKAIVVSGKSNDSDSLFGDVFSATPAQPNQRSWTVASGGLPVSTATVPSSPTPQPSVRPNLPQPQQATFSSQHQPSVRPNLHPSQEATISPQPQPSVRPNLPQSQQATFSPQPQPSVRPNLTQSHQATSSQQPVTGQYQHVHLAGKQSQQFSVQNTPTTSTGFSVGAANSASSQPQGSWPTMTQSDVQKYTKVFVQVDTDRDGKITGEQARNLFLSWRLPREILKQVWDLSDQDNDSMLSLKEFCTALYLLERFREGRPLPASFPRNILPDDALFTATAAPYISAPRGPVAGFQQPAAPRPPAGKPPRAGPIPQMDRPPQPPPPQKPKVPSLEKHLVDQLSKGEQDALNEKLKDATEADKKVEELEKDIITSREKTHFYHSKMQELVLYKSRCDNRLNEITERVSGDKREVDLLAKKYEEKYKKSGDVASKLTIEESTFRDIQEKKMELYQAIVKMQGDSGDTSVKELADGIQTQLEELVKFLNERCKQYGLRSKPTSLVELPFGWQPGIQEGAADWDGEWDKLENEGYAYVKEFTLDIENVIAPPKPKTLLVRKEMTSTNEDATSPDAEDKSKKVTSKGGEGNEKEPTHEPKENGVPSSPGSTARSSATETPSGVTDNQTKEHQESQIKDIDDDGSPQAKDASSEQGGPKSIFSGEKTSDEPSWGTFDANYDSESVWGFDNDKTKDLDNDRQGGSTLFGFEDFNLKPIRTDPSKSKISFPGKNSIFADSVPSTPSYSISGSPRRSSGGQDDYSFETGKITSIFDSVPSTPAYNSFNVGKNSSIFADSVPSTPAYNSFDKGHNSSMFADSVPSTPAYNFENTPRRFSGGSEDYSFDTFSRFDSFNMHDQSPSLSRFDSVRDGRDSDPGLGYLPKFDSFNAHEGNLFQSSQSSLSRFDSMRSNKDYDPGHGFSSFDDSDPFGSTGPFRTSMETPRRSENDYFGSSGSFPSETPRTSDADYFGSSGPFRTSTETPRSSEADFFSSGPFKTSMETPRKSEADFFASSGPDPFGSSGPFKTSTAETPRSRSDDWSAF